VGARVLAAALLLTGAGLGSVSTAAASADVVDPSPSPTASASPIPTASASPSPTASGSPSPTASASPLASPQPAATPTPVVVTPETDVQALVATGSSDVQALANSLPIGSFDGLSFRGWKAQGWFYVLSGWAIDPDDAEPVTVHIYVDGAWFTSSDANGSRIDVGAAYPGYGDQHGFGGMFKGSEGRHEVCVYAIDHQVDASTPLGCRSVVVGNPPNGNFESATAVGSAVTVKGWAYDEDDQGDPAEIHPVDVHVYIDGVWGGRVVTDRLRPDVVRRYPAAKGSGFLGTIPTGPGAHEVCAYAIDTSYAEVNTPLGCHSVYVGGNALPIGNFEDRSVVGSSVTVTGWALDLDDPAAAVAVHFYVQKKDGPRAGMAVTTAVARPDVAAAYPGAGPNQGFSGTFTLGAGEYEVCAYAIDNQVDASTLLRCFPIYIA
jgi:hypothetical protein